VRETWRGDSFTGDPGGYVEKALEMGISLYRGPAGEPGRGLINQGLTRDFERHIKGALEEECLSLRELCEGNLEGGAPLLGTLEDVKRKALEMGISLHRGPSGEHGTGHIYWGLMKDE